MSDTSHVSEAAKQFGSQTQSADCENGKAMLRQLRMLLHLTGNKVGGDFGTEHTCSCRSCHPVPIVCWACWLSAVGVLLVADLEWGIRGAWRPLGGSWTRDGRCHLRHHLCKTRQQPVSRRFRYMNACTKCSKELDLQGA